jgi:hypothetical protein
MKVRALVLLAILAGCSSSKVKSLPNDAGTDVADGSAAGAPDAAAGLVLPPSCAAETQQPPTDLVCTGLYANIATKQLAPGIEAYAPAVPLWSDGAQKQRWISLPPGQVIDNSNPDEWTFPVGTKVWKEFSMDGRRIETRLWQKADTNYWVDATYAWNADESAATQSAGGDIPLGTRTYHIPTPDECQDCHRGRTDRILGFDQVLLGLAGATGLTLDQLIAEHRLSTPPTSTPLVIGDDGTGLAAPALAWLHVNCGTTCHNRNSNAMAWSTGLFMRLEPTELDGRSVSGFDTLTTSIGVPAVTPTWKGQSRILPGDPAHSLLYDLISHRGTGAQMPPIATSFVDQADIPLIEAWIAELPKGPETGTGGTAGAGGTKGSGGAAGTTAAGGTAGSSGATGGGAPGVGGSGGATAGGTGGTTLAGAGAGGTAAGGVAGNATGGSGGASGTAGTMGVSDAGLPITDASESADDGPNSDGSTGDF